jgi:hypothetical protein
MQLPEREIDVRTIEFPVPDEPRPGPSPGQPEPPPNPDPSKPVVVRRRAAPAGPES